MDIQKLSTQYTVRKISDIDIPSVLELCKSNPLYFKFCPPAVSAEEIRADLYALPPQKTYLDKYYVGFFYKDELVAVMDLVLNYPDNETAFIGFFMVEAKLQKKGIGSNIIAECMQYLKQLGFTRIRLGYVKGNDQSKAFWEKNQFLQTGIEAVREYYTIVIMEKAL